LTARAARTSARPFIDVGILILIVTVRRQVVGLVMATVVAGYAPNFTGSFPSGIEKRLE
jgi:hypothetical protein